MTGTAWQQGTVVAGSAGRRQKGKVLGMHDSSIPGRLRPRDETVRVASNNLFSKHGFEDGGSPDAWFDYWHDWRTPPAGETPEFPWAEVVRRYLLPALDQQVTVTELLNHNPVRAVTVDGGDVTGAGTARTCRGRS